MQNSMSRLGFYNVQKSATLKHLAVAVAVICGASLTEARAASVGSATYVPFFVQDKYLTLSTRTSQTYRVSMVALIVRLRTFILSMI